MARETWFLTRFSGFHPVIREFIRGPGIGGALFLLPLVFFWPETLGLRAYFHHDLQYYFYPYHKVVADIVAAGNLPLWNPYALGGMPLVGDGQTALFYPPNLLFFVLPAEHALSLVVLLHYGIAGAGTYAYVRYLGLVRSAAVIAALSFMFNGFLVSRVVHYSISAGAALVPLLFLAVDRLLVRPSRGRFAIAALAVCLQAVAGHPQIPIYTAVALGLYCAAIGAQHWRQRWHALTPLALLIGVYLAGYALAAVQLLPWIEWATFSVRAANASFEFVSYHSLHNWDWLLFLFPYGFGGLQDNMMQSRPVWRLPVYLWERLSYVGLVPLGLAVVGLATLGRPEGERERGRDGERERQGEGETRGAGETVQGGEGGKVLRRERWVALVVVIVGMLLIAAGSSTPAGYLVYLVPALGKLRAYARAVAIAAFAVAVLAAYGAHRLATAGHRPRAVRSAMVGGLLVFGAVELTLLLANAVPIEQLVAWWPSLEREGVWKIAFELGLQLREANAYMPLLLATASGILLIMAAFRPRAMVAPLLLLTAVDMLLFARAFNPTIDAAAFHRVPGSVEFLRSDPGFRTAIFLTHDQLPFETAQAQLAVSWALAYGVEEINGFNSLQTRRNLNLLFDTDEEDVSYGKLRNARLLESGNPVLDLFNVKYAVVQHQFDEPLPEELTERNDPEAVSRWERAYRDEYVTIYRNREPLPRAFFTAGVTAQPDPRAVYEAVIDYGFDPRNTSVVEGMPAERAASLAAATPGSVELRQISPNELHLTTDAASEQLLVLSETWAPGWHASVDGRPAAIWRTNYVFRGIVVPAGTHEVRLVYRPASLLWGAAISGLAVVGLVVAVLTQRRTGISNAKTQRRKEIVPGY